MPPTILLLLLLLISLLLLFLMSLASHHSHLWCPPTHLCVCVCSHAPSRLLSMLMMLILFMLSTPDCHPTTARVFPPLCCTITHFPRHSPAVCCYLESQHTHTPTHTPSCSPVCFLESPHGCVFVCLFFAESLLFFSFSLTEPSHIEMIKIHTEKNNNKQKG